MAVTVTLTPDELALIRLNLGDGCDKLTDEQIQLAYNTAEGDECGTNAILARQLWMGVRIASARLDDGTMRISTALVDEYKRRYDFWADCAGIGGGKITAGVIGLGLDATEEWLATQFNQTEG